MCPNFPSLFQRVYLFSPIHPSLSQYIPVSPRLSQYLLCVPLSPCVFWLPSECPSIPLCDQLHPCVSQYPLGVPVSLWMSHFPTEHPSIPVCVPVFALGVSVPPKFLCSIPHNKQRLIWDSYMFVDSQGVGSGVHTTYNHTIVAWSSFSHTNKRKLLD